jgi:hypothetical protein
MKLPRPSFANVVSLIALFVALGGTSYAVVKLPKNSVRAKQIAPGAVGSSEVRDRSLLSKDFKPGQLPVGAQGPQGPQGAQGPAGAVHVYQGTGESGDVARFFGTTLVKLAVPPGSYLVIAALEADNATGGTTSITCRLISGALQGTQRSQDLTFPNEENMSLLGAFRVAAGDDVQLQCGKADADKLVRAFTARVEAVQITGFDGDLVG